ncbi:MAG: RdgB/HAM1 family non-canonical purine NTP pyrophosphatase, partial [Salinibacterium sp.]|nr:RdgB/HAM1 family non-canonical purine NTP pyrophosphatase [Salinibacterium sp.]
MRVVLATHNAHKVTELTSILGPALNGIELVTYDGPEPVEDGATFEENALIKARAASAQTGLPALADDSGICVDALGGAPGIHSARYSGTRVDADNVAKLLQDLGIESNRAAQFVCAAALVIPGETGSSEFVERGTWHGSVLHQPTGAHGFGYDPIFKPEELSVSSAELHPDQKNAISHRKLAFAALLAARGEL